MKFRTQLRRWHTILFLIIRGGNPAIEGNSSLPCRFAFSRPSHWPRRRDKSAIRLDERRLSEVCRHECLWTVWQWQICDEYGNRHSEGSGHNCSARVVITAVRLTHTARPSSQRDRLCARTAVHSTVHLDILLYPSFHHFSILLVMHKGRRVRSFIMRDVWVFS